MSAHTIVEAVFLGLVVLACWVGALGMWRMRDPTQALHYVSLPATVGVIALSVAVFVDQGASVTSWKTLLIALILMTTGSIGNHAAARAFRARDLGHWEPLDGDPMEFVRDTEEAS